MTRSVAVIGAGLIGRAWAIVFARAGFDVALNDVSADALATARIAIDDALANLADAGLIVEEPAAVLGRIRGEPDLAAAVAGAVYVQECGPEREADKRALFAELDRLAAPEAILASSTSGIVASRIVAGLSRPQRCLVAHPVNPPYLIPLVELAPGPETDPAVVRAARALLDEAGQVPITVHGEVEGFILNRLQGAVLNEALRLVQAGHVSVADLDRTMKHGLGTRWSFIGPFETIDLNAPGGIADYARRYGPLYQRIDADAGEPPDWGEAAIAGLERERRESLPADALNARQQWRDRRLMALAVHQRRMQETQDNEEGT